MSTTNHQRELLAAICDRFRDGEGVPGRFFSMENIYLFIGEYKYWLMTRMTEKIAKANSLLTSTTRSIERPL